MEAEIDQRVDSALQTLMASSRGTLYEAIAKHYDQLVELRSMGHSLQSIAKVLTETGVPITRQMLHNYLKKIESTGRKPKKMPASITSDQKQTLNPDAVSKGQPLSSITPEKEKVTKTSPSVVGTVHQEKTSAMPPAVSDFTPQEFKRKERDELPPIPTDWPMVRKRVNGVDMDLHQSPKGRLYSVLPGVDPDVPYGKNEVGVSYNRYGELTRSMIGKGFIGEDL